MKKWPVLWVLLLYIISSYGAVHLSQDQTGQALVIPYFTVANGLNTLVSINNTENQPKAIKIHIKEGLLARSMYSFNLYLNANDTWTFAMAAGDNNLQLFSNDTSCVINLTPSTEPPQGPDLPSWDWQTGLVEIIEMGNFSTASNQFFNSPTAAENCEQINQAWYANGPNSLWQASPDADLTPATGGLAADVKVINVPNGFSFEIPVLALNDFFEAGTIYHREPESTLPDLASGSSNSLLIHQGEAIFTSWPTGFEAISALLMKTTVDNHFTTNPLLGAKTEWILTFPTWTYHAANLETHQPFLTNEMGEFKFPDDFSQGYFVADQSANRYSLHHCCIDPYPPFSNHHLNSVVNTYTIKHIEDMTDDSISGAVRPNVVPFYYHKGTTFYPPESYFFDGKISLRFTEQRNYLSNQRGLDTMTQEAVSYHGLPVLGFSAVTYINANAQPGLLAIYAHAKPHTGHRLITTSTED